MSRFPLIERYLGLRMGVDLKDVPPGALKIVESAQRLKPEPSYGFLRVLTWIETLDGRRVVSVPVGARQAIEKAIEISPSGDAMGAQGVQESLTAVVNSFLLQAGCRQVDRCFRDLVFTCNAPLLNPHRHGECRRILDETTRAAEGMKLPTHCFPDGVVYGVIADGQVVSEAHAHRTALMEENVCDVGIGTAAAYRRRGYAQTALSALVSHFTEHGGEAIYRCSPDNDASISTARSVGFVPYGRGLVLGAPIAPAATNLNIRRAIPDDADCIARIHVDTWRSTYSGIVPDQYLASLSYEKHVQAWHKWLSDVDSVSFTLVAESEGQIVGFATGGPERGGHPLYKGELWGAYVLTKFQRRGVGRTLTSAVVEELRLRGFDSMLVWVLKDNPCRAFYVRLGGVPAGEKEIEIGGKKLIEVAYGWSDLRALASPGKRLEF